MSTEAVIYFHIPKVQPFDGCRHWVLLPSTILALSKYLESRENNSTKTRRKPPKDSELSTPQIPSEDVCPIYNLFCQFLNCTDFHMQNIILLDLNYQ